MTSTFTASEVERPPPPPPPPMPHERLKDETLGIDLVSPNFIHKPQMKMRTLNWRRIPKKKVLSQQVSGAKLSNETMGDATNFDNLTATNNRSCLPEEDEEATEEANENNDDKNLWFLIAKANKSIQEVKPAPSEGQTEGSSSNSSSKSASRIREMLESVRRRMAAVTAGQSLNGPSLCSENKEKPPNKILEVIDFQDLENLFCLTSQPASDSLDSDSPNFVRRLSMRTNASSDSVISSNSYSNDEEDDDFLSLEIDNILDSKKSLNVNIFLKQLKNPDDLIEQINRDDNAAIGQERLESLLKLLPDESEERKLVKFLPGQRRNRLPVAERFLLQLISEVPNLRLRIKFMKLKEEYSTDLELIGPELDKIEAAANEIRRSKLLRDTLSLILVTGNFLNTGGYAADAAGFSLDCLESLAEVRSNKQGVHLIHYLAEMAAKLNLTEFLQNELPHVECASRVCTDTIKMDLSSMMDKINELRRDCDKEAEVANAEEKLYLLNLLRTLEDIKSNVEFLRRRISINLESTRSQLANYLCEDPDSFKLNECFRHLLNFSQRLKTATDENNRRRQRELSKLDRSNCSLKRSNTINPKLMRSTKSQSRQSLGNLNPKHSFSYLANSSFGGAGHKRASIGGFANSNDSLQSAASKSNLSRTTSTYNVSTSSRSSINSNNQVKDFDDLHEGLMRMLVDTDKKRVCGGSSIKSQPFGSYRRTSKLFRPLTSADSKYQETTSK